MAFAKRSIVGAAALITLAVCLALCGPARAVGLNNLVAKKEPLSFAQMSLATATKAELNAALQSATQAEMHAAMKSTIQTLVSEEIGQLIEQEMNNGNLFDSVKGLASGALGDLMGGLRASMGETCQRLAALAQSKLDLVDERLGQIAGTDEADNGADQSDAHNSFAEKYAPVSRAATAPQASALQQPTPEFSADRLAFLQVALRQKHKGFFDKIKGFFRRGIKKVKKIGSYVKKGVKSIWSIVKPAVALGVKSAVVGLKNQVPGIIGQACDDAEDKLQHYESKLLPDDEAIEEEDMAAVLP